MYHLTSCEWECFLLSSVLKASEKFSFKVPVLVITQSSDLSGATFLCPLFVFRFLFPSFPLPCPCAGSSWSLELQSEAEFAETLLAGSLGLCLTMHNWALLLAYSHGCTLFSWNGQECNPPHHHHHHHFSQPSLEDLNQTVTKCTRPAYQRGQAWHGLALNGTRTAKRLHTCADTYTRGRVFKILASARFFILCIGHVLQRYVFS